MHYKLRAFLILFLFSFICTKSQAQPGEKCKCPPLNVLIYDFNAENVEPADVKSATEMGAWMTARTITSGAFFNEIFHSISPDDIKLFTRQLLPGTKTGTTGLVFPPSGPVNADV